jgi:hypothetical protein
VQAIGSNSEAVSGEFQVLFYNANDEFISYTAASSSVSSFSFMPPTNATQCMVQMYYDSGTISNFDIYSYVIPIVLTQFDDKTTLIPISTPLTAGVNIDITNYGVGIDTWSGENTLTIPTTVTPRVKLTYKEPMNTSYERITQSVTPITINADGTNLMNWIIYGAEGGVGGSVDIFSGGVSEKFYDYSTGEYMPSVTGYYSSDNLIPITEGVTYTAGGVYSSTAISGYWAIYYDSNGDYVGYSNGGGLSITFTSPAGASSVRIESSGRAPTTFFLNAPALPVTVTQGTNSQTVVIPINAPLTENQSVSMEGTGIDIPTYNGQTTISVASQVQPTMKIQYMEKRS